MRCPGNMPRSALPFTRVAFSAAKLRGWLLAMSAIILLLTGLVKLISTTAATPSAACAHRHRRNPARRLLLSLFPSEIKCRLVSLVFFTATALQNRAVGSWVATTMQLPRWPYGMPSTYLPRRQI